MNRQDFGGNLEAPLMPIDNGWGLHCIGKSLLLCFASGFSLLSANINQAAIADIIPDDTLGSESTIVDFDRNLNGEIVDLIRGGAIRDDKLFHSFLEFNIDLGQKVYFEHSSHITKIYSRVTGENQSIINGLIGVPGAADLLFSNPNGVHFGAEAETDITGNFSVNTGLGFTAENPDNGSMATPSLLQINLEPGLQRATPNSEITSLAHLSVGGDLNFEAAFLDIQGSLMAGGHINLAGSDILVRDTLTEATILEAENLTIAGDRVQLLLHRHPNSGIFSRGAIAVMGREETILQGRMETNVEDLNEDSGLDDLDISAIENSEPAIAPPENVETVGSIGFIGDKIIIQDTADGATIVKTSGDLILQGNDIKILLRHSDDSEIVADGGISITEYPEEMDDGAIAENDLDDPGTSISEPPLVTGDDPDNAPIVWEIEGRMRAGDDIEILGPDITIRDTEESATAIASGGEITIEGDRIDILLNQHSESEMVVEGAISIAGRKVVLIKGRIEAIEKEAEDDLADLNADNMIEETLSGIFLTSESKISLRKAMLNVLTDSGTVAFDAPTLKISASEVGAEIIDLSANIVEIVEKSELYSRDFKSPSLGRIGIRAPKRIHIDRVDIVLQTSRGSIRIASPRIIIESSTISNESPQSTTTPKISFDGDVLTVKKSEIGTTSANENSTNDIEFNFKDLIEFSEGTSILAAGDIDISTQSLDSPPNAVRSQTGTVNVEIFATPALPPLPEIPAIATVSLGIPVEDATIEPVPDLQIDFEESEQQLGSNNNPDIALKNGCVVDDGEGNFTLQKPQSNPLSPYIDVAGFPSLNPPRSGASVASIDARAATGAFRLSSGEVVLSRLCVASVLSAGGFIA